MSDATVEERVEERFEVQLRAEMLKTISMNGSLRFGESDDVEIGVAPELGLKDDFEGGSLRDFFANVTTDPGIRANASDVVVGKSHEETGGKLVERVPHRRKDLITDVAELRTTVGGRLSLEGHSETMLVGGTMTDHQLGGVSVLAGMSDDMIVGAGTRAVGGVDLWLNGLMGMEEKFATVANDGILTEVYGRMFDREFGTGTHNVGVVIFTGATYTTMATGFRPLWRFMNGVRNHTPGGGAGGGGGQAPAGGSAPAAAGTGSAVVQGAGGTAGAAGGADNVADLARLADASEDASEVQTTRRAETAADLEAVQNAQTVEDMSTSRHADDVSPYADPLALANDGGQRKPRETNPSGTTGTTGTTAEPSGAGQQAVSPYSEVWLDPRMDAMYRQYQEKVLNVVAVGTSTSTTGNMDEVALTEDLLAIYNERFAAIFDNPSWVDEQTSTGLEDATALTRADVEDSTATLDAFKASDELEDLQAYQRNADVWKELAEKMRAGEDPFKVLDDLEKSSTAAGSSKFVDFDEVRGQLTRLLDNADTRSPGAISDLRVDGDYGAASYGTAPSPILDDLSDASAAAAMPQDGGNWFQRISRRRTASGAADMASTTDDADVVSRYLDNVWSSQIDGSTVPDVTPGQLDLDESSLVKLSDGDPDPVTTTSADDTSTLGRTLDDPGSGDETKPKKKKVTFNEETEIQEFYGPIENTGDPVTGTLAEEPQKPEGMSWAEWKGNRKGAGFLYERGPDGMGMWDGGVYDTFTSADAFKFNGDSLAYTYLSEAGEASVLSDADDVPQRLQDLIDQGNAPGLRMKNGGDLSQDEYKVVLKKAREADTAVAKAGTGVEDAEAAVKAAEKQYQLQKNLVAMGLADADSVGDVELRLEQARQAQALAQTQLEDARQAQATALANLDKFESDVIRATMEQDVYESVLLKIQNGEDPTEYLQARYLATQDPSASENVKALDETLKNLIEEIGVLFPQDYRPVTELDQMTEADRAALFNRLTSVAEPAESASESAQSGHGLTQEPLETMLDELRDRYRPAQMQHSQELDTVQEVGNRRIVYFDGPTEMEVEINTKTQNALKGSLTASVGDVSEPYRLAQSELLAGRNPLDAMNARLEDLRAEEAAYLKLMGDDSDSIVVWRNTEPVLDENGEVIIIPRTERSVPGTDFDVVDLQKFIADIESRPPGQELKIDEVNAYVMAKQIQQRRAMIDAYEAALLETATLWSVAKIDTAEDLVALDEAKYLHDLQVMEQVHQLHATGDVLIVDDTGRAVGTIEIEFNPLDQGSLLPDDDITPASDFIDAPPGMERQLSVDVQAQVVSTPPVEPAVDGVDELGTILNDLDTDEVVEFPPRKRRDLGVLPDTPVFRDEDGNVVRFYPDINPSPDFGWDDHRNWRVQWESEAKRNGWIVDETDEFGKKRRIFQDFDPTGYAFVGAHTEDQAGARNAWMRDHLMVLDEFGNPVLDEHGNPVLRWPDQKPVGELTTEEWQEARVLQLKTSDNKVLSPANKLPPDMDGLAMRKQIRDDLMGPYEVTRRQQLKEKLWAYMDAEITSKYPNGWQDLPPEELKRIVEEINERVEEAIASDTVLKMLRQAATTASDGYNPLPKLELEIVAYEDFMKTLTDPEGVARSKVVHEEMKRMYDELARIFPESNLQPPEPLPQKAFAETYDVNLKKAEKEAAAIISDEVNEFKEFREKVSTGVKSDFKWKVDDMPIFSGTESKGGVQTGTGEVELTVVLDQDGKWRYMDKHGNNMTEFVYEKFGETEQMVGPKDGVAMFTVDRDAKGLGYWGTGFDGDMNVPDDWDFVRRTETLQNDTIEAMRGAWQHARKTGEDPVTFLRNEVQRLEYINGIRPTAETRNQHEAYQKAYDIISEVLNPHRVGAA